MRNESSSTLREIVSRSADQLKALLVLVVAADHNDWFRQINPDLFEPLTFHVLGFLLLAFTFGEKRLSTDFVLDRIARYLIPFWWVLTGACIGYAVLFKPPGGTVGELERWVLAAAIGNAPYVKSASGLLMLWFLPCLFGLSCLIAAFDSLATRLGRRVAVILAFAGHLLLPIVPAEYLHRIPFGLAIAVEVFILGLVWRYLLSARLIRSWGIVAVFTFAISYGVLVSGPTHLELGTLAMAGLNDFTVLMLQDVAGVSGVLSALWIAEALPEMRLLDAVGQHSLLVYLLHPIAYVVLGRLPLFAIQGDAAPAVLLFEGLIAGCLAVGLALFAAQIVSRSRRMSAWITPRAWRQWPPLSVLRR